MDDYSLKTSELEAASNALERILGQAVEEIELSDTVPVLDEVSDSNKVFKGKLSILFVDIRNSVNLTDELKSKRMVKVYRGFVRMAIQAIRYSGGFTRQFAGDCVMGVFQDSFEDNCTISSSAKAVTAARYIHTLIDYCLNPALKNQMGDVCIGCGVGIATGPILITKVGMRGKEADEVSENETGIVWVGSTTNYANRNCSLADAGEIFIDEKTYREIGNPTGWEKASRVKGNKVFKGYTAREFYLPLPTGFAQEAVRAETDHNQEKSFVQEIFDETQERALLLVNEISKKSSELSTALNDVKIREQRVAVREEDAQKENTRLSQLKSRLDAQQSRVNAKDAENKNTEYNLYKHLFVTVHCKKTLAIEMGEAFWEDNLQHLIQCGRAIGKSEKEVKGEICYALVDLYRNLGKYEDAYYALCIQAETHPWIHSFTVENVLSKTYLRTQLKDTIEDRLKAALKPDLRKSLQECLLLFK